MNGRDYSLQNVNLHLRNNERKDDSNAQEFYPASERAGFNYGKSISKMVSSLSMSERDKDEFMRGINKAIFKSLKWREGHRNNRGDTRGPQGNIRRPQGNTRGPQGNTREDFGNR